MSNCDYQPQGSEGPTTDTTHALMRSSASWTACQGQTCVYRISPSARILSTSTRPESHPLAKTVGPATRAAGDHRLSFLLRNIGRLAMASRGSRIRVKTPVGGDNGVKWPPSLRLRPGPTTLGFKALSVANVDNRRT